MKQIGSRRRNQPAPPRILFESLTQPNRDPRRPWLTLLPDEQMPTITGSLESGTVTWTSLWPKRTDAVLVFELPSDGGSGTDLRWTLYVEGEEPDQSTVGHFRKRINLLINGKLRSTYGQ